ncbi:helicase C-terminal domain-containing protein [Rhodococcus sp. X156]|uniref:helicase-associated domain-containing protein n=1 Tax=Rhodococcus sp. X156 TaxID=2499145 RepID=UPI000FDC5E9D|nr:helicase C-terminal domain-containing protein [Rhodococcus sp. X156]
MSDPRSLAAWLSRQSDQQLSTLLELRPDLAVPPPADSQVLANRAGLRASVVRAADELTAFELAVLEAMVLAQADAEPVSVADVRELLGSSVPATKVNAALERLRAQALVWGPDKQLDGIRVAPAMREVLPRAGQVGRPSAALVDADVPAMLAELDAARLGLLTTLAKGAPFGRTRDAAPGTPADRPVQQLLRAGLLLPVDDQTVELPSQVSAVLRGGSPMGEISPTEPRATPTSVTRQDMDSAAAGAALELLRHCTDLLAALGAAPAPTLRAGGLGVRELRRLAKQTGIDEAALPLLLELLAAAGLVASDEAADPAWTPTTHVDTWAVAEPAARWAELATAWLELPRLPGLVGERDERDKALATLSEELRRPLAPRDRRRVLQVLADLPPGSALDAAQVGTALSWRRPRWGGRLREDLIRWTLAEATTVGVLGRGALSTPGRALLAGGDVEAAMAVALPAPVDHVLVQADLTVVAPGPLEPELEQDIALVADVESAGAATVYRVGPSSVRRALDAGRSAAELHALFAERSHTPVPQALTYLIDDVARRHGRLRTGTAGSFVRCDDEALLSEVVASPIADELGLRRLAPTVAVAPVSLAELLEGLRSAGFAPAAEDPTGAVLDLRPRGARVEARRSRRRSPVPTPPSAEQRAAVVRGVRAGDRAATMTPANRVVSDGSRASGMATMAVLQQAARERRSVWIGYVDAQGTASQRVVEPVSVGAGVLEGFDSAAAGIRRFALHRITSVALTDE